MAGRHCERKRSKNLINGKMDCFVAKAPRNDARDRHDHCHHRACPPALSPGMTPCLNGCNAVVQRRLLCWSSVIVRDGGRSSTPRRTCQAAGVTS
jgi:hypothetical protein